MIKTNNDPHNDKFSPFFAENWTDKEALPSVHHPFALQFPGITEEARRTCARLLKKNHAAHHCYFNDKGFHNHLMHHLLAAFSFGASPERLEEIYELNDKDQRPIGPFVEPEITEDNWNKFFGKAEYYSNYLRFFTREIRKSDSLSVINSYVFDTTKEGNSDFFSCVMGGVYHPFIHIGYGLEFSLDMLIAEGLAMAAVTKTNFKPLLLDPPSDFPIVASLDTAMNALTSLTSSLGLTPPNDKPTTAFGIINYIHSDNSLDGIIKWEDSTKFMTVIQNIPSKVKEYAKQWAITQTKEDVLIKTKELIGISMVLYAGTPRPALPVKLDFFLMHSLTSALFLPIYICHLTPAQAVRLLQAHFAVTIAFYISRGRPRLHLSDNLSLYKPELDGYNNNSTSNPWLTVINRAIAHDDQHVVKAIRTLVWGGTYLAHHKPSEEPKDTPGEHQATSHYWLNGALMTLDGVRGDRWWQMNGIGFDEFWDGKTDPGPNMVESEFY